MPYRAEAKIFRHPDQTRMYIDIPDRITESLATILSCRDSQGIDVHIHNAYVKEDLVVVESHKVGEQAFLKIENPGRIKGRVQPVLILPRLGFHTDLGLKPGDSFDVSFINLVRPEGLLAALAIKPPSRLSIFPRLNNELPSDKLDGEITPNICEADLEEVLNALDEVERNVVEVYRLAPNQQEKVHSRLSELKENIRSSAKANWKGYLFRVVGGIACDLAFNGVPELLLLCFRNAFLEIPSLFEESKEKQISNSSEPQT